MENTYNGLAFTNDDYPQQEWNEVAINETEGQFGFAVEEDDNAFSEPDEEETPKVQFSEDDNDDLIDDDENDEDDDDEDDDNDEPSDWGNVDPQSGGFPSGNEPTAPGSAV